ncbi:MAG: 3-methyladenine DNA glycosylase [Rickettsiales bacterium]|nr:3-methyladenine DNA glycosylase [Rickettsiales bacterium]
MTGRWTKEHFGGAAEPLAERLLGASLVRVLADGSRLAGRIVETEAYLGVMDRAAHAFGGRRTARNETMYAAAGTSYVYLIYGMYHCFNVVCGELDEPTAVLIRALEPVEGLVQMQQARPRARRQRDLCSGPGKLCQALRIDRSLDGACLASGEAIYVEGAQGPPAASRVVRCARIGVDYAGSWAARPLRYYLHDSDHVSKKLRPS